MKIMWIVNIPLPEVSKLMGERPTPFGGWLINTSNRVAKSLGSDLIIAFPKEKSNNIKKYKGKEILYYSFPPLESKNDRQGINSITNIIKKENPDVVHIFGTEYAHALVAINACLKYNIKHVVSIQGLVSVCEKHYMAYLPREVQKKSTIRDFIKKDNLIQQQKKMAFRGRLEIEALEKTENIIGRTTWDLACMNQINPKAKYYHCNETLREEFYQHQWTLDNAERFSIFLSQSSYPLKGLHLMLEAMPLVLKKFPDAKLYIAGDDLISDRNLKKRIKRTYYMKYISKLIKKYNLENKVIFTGILNEKEMCKRYLQSNIFVCPSSIENSPNSLGEAMLLGVPSIASNVGGIPDMLVHKKDGFLYQADAPYMLAFYISEIFKDIDLTFKLSNNARQKAKKIFDVDENENQLLSIYKSIIKEE